jgi:hypothetical protein
LPHAVAVKLTNKDLFKYTVVDRCQGTVRHSSTSSYRKCQLIVVGGQRRFNASKYSSDSDDSSGER